MHLGFLSLCSPWGSRSTADGAALRRAIPPNLLTTLITPTLALQSHAQTCLYWSDTFEPYGRAYPSLAYDSGVGAAVLFGGGTGGTGITQIGESGAVWEWDGRRWATRNAADAVAHRAGHTMTYDSRRDKLVLFGGASIAGVLGDIWEYDGRGWTRRDANGPSPRSYAAIAYDSRRGVVVLFSGSAGPGSELMDTWEYDGQSWVQRSNIGPSARFWSMMAFDAARGVTVLFGGQRMNAPWPSHLGDTWEWNGTVWTQRVVQGPEPRTYGAMAYDEQRQRLILHGGWTTDRRDVTMNDTWEYDGLNWVLRATADPTNGYHTYPMMCYDDARHVVVRIGILNEYSAYGVWEWDGVAWSQRNPPDPGPRYDYALAFDRQRQTYVLFGGTTRVPGGSPFKSNETWEFDGRRWTLRNGVGPSARTRPDMTYDTRRGVCVLFGGDESSTSTPAPSGETWEWDGQTWTLRATSGPAPRFYHAMAFDEARGVSVLFGGGVGRSMVYGDTWEWNGIAWSLRGATLPPPRTEHALIYDPLHQVCVLAGGLDGTLVHSDVWEWDGTTWQSAGQLDGYAAGGAGSGCNTFEPCLRKPLLLNYNQFPSALYPQLWTRDAQTWSLVGTFGPIWRLYADAASDAARGVKMLYGGRLSFPQNGTWFLGTLWVSEQPQPQTVPTGQRARFRAGGLGGGTVTFQWRRDGLPLADDGRIVGAASSLLDINDASPADAGSYDCVIANECATVTTQAAPLMIAPAIHPADLNCDGLVNNLDIDPFVLALVDAPAYSITFPNCNVNNADINQDGLVNNLDIDPFVTCLINLGCP